MAQRKYSREEADAILGRAIEREHRGDDLAHEDLLAAAREIGIPEQAIETAAAEIAAERSERAELVELRRDQWRGFVAHLVPYLLVNGLLVTINFLTTHFPWAIFPALGWGIGLASHLLAVLFPTRATQQYHLEQHRRELKQQTCSEAHQLDAGHSDACTMRVTPQDAEPTDDQGESDRSRHETRERGR